MSNTFEPRLDNLPRHQQVRSELSTLCNLAIIDLECTCEQNIALDPSEIIEIGAVVGSLTHDSFIVTSEIQIYVKPVVHPKLTEFCTQLTGISQTTVDNAVELPEALIDLSDWLQLNHVNIWGSWGKFDASQFSRECQLKKLPNPMDSIQHFNIKQLFARRFKQRAGLVRALELRSLKFQGAPHSGLDDSKNIGLLLSHEAILRAAILERTAVQF